MKTPTPLRIVLQGWALISLLILLPVVQAQTVQPTWTQLFPAGSPVEREAHSAVYDEAHNRMIIFGGRSLSGSLNDAWILSNADGLGGSPSWIPLTPGIGPSPRAFHSAVYDSANNRMIVFGGEPSSNDVWVLSNANGLEVTPAAWTQLSPTGAIPKRLGHSAVYDTANNKMIIFGGEMSLGVFSAILDDIWVLSNANGLGGTPTWTKLSPAGAIVGREMHSAIYDAAHNRMVVFGGYTANLVLSNDVWVLSNANGLGGTPAWTQLSPTGAISSRNSHSAVYDTSTNRMTVFGGIANFMFVNDVWVLSNANGLGGAPAWTQLTPTGGPSPSVREGHSAVYHSATSSMTVFGGRLVQGWAKDVWVLSSGAQDITVQILIKPGEDSRPATVEIEPGNEELIAVAILSSPTFDPLTMVDRTSLTFGRTGSEPSLAFCYDSSQDDEPRVGMHALICQFSIQKAGFLPADSIGVLKGKTVTGTYIRGTDSIRIEAEGDK